MEMLVNLAMKGVQIICLLIIFYIIIVPAKLYDPWE